MKRYSVLTILLALMVGFASCQKADVGTSDAQGGSEIIRETFNATFVEEDTKTSTDDGGITVKWAANDRIYYFSSNFQDEIGAMRIFTITADGASATLQLERNPKDSYYNLFYSGGYIPSVLLNVETYFAFDGVRQLQDGTFSNANISVAKAYPGIPAITFKPATAIVKFSTSKTDATIFFISGGADEYIAGNTRINPGAETPKAFLIDGSGKKTIKVMPNSSDAGTYYVNVLPKKYENGLVISFANFFNVVLGTVKATKSIDLDGGGKMINLGNIDSHFKYTGELEGVFSISATKKVHFSRGNLYYDTKKGTWQFEEKQYQYRTAIADNKVGSFYWSKKDSVSFAASYSDPSASASDVLFTNDPSDATKANSAFTVYGSKGVWRTLTGSSGGEWDYLLCKRKVNGATGEGHAFQRATVCGVYGLIIYPDNYTSQTGESNYSSSQWTAMEAAGCVFLPAAGNRLTSSTAHENTTGTYLSSIAATAAGSYYLNFSAGYFGQNEINVLRGLCGMSIRLVKDAE